MARDLTGLMQTQVAAAFKRPIILYSGDFVSDTVRLWTGLGDLSWGGYTWNGAGNLLGMSEVTETAGVTAQGCTLRLSGMPSSLIAEVELNARHGLAGTVYLGFVDAAGAVISTPYPIFRGRLDIPEISDSGADCTISITYESHLVRLLTPRVRRWTYEDTQIDHPGDLGFQFASSLVGQVLEW